MQLSHAENFLISLFGSPKDDGDIIKTTNTLLEFYTYAFLDEAQASSKSMESLVKDFFKEPERLMSKAEVLNHSIDILKKQKLIELKADPIFNGFSKLNVRSILANQVNSNYEKEGKLISLFKESLIKYLEAINTKKSRFEIRYFYSWDDTPEFYDFGGVFNPITYVASQQRDGYVVNDSHVNLKKRKNKYQIKEDLDRIGYITKYAKKKNLDELPAEVCPLGSIAVVKERFIRKFQHKTKAEFALIFVGGQEWKTICLESKYIEIVLALSMLIKQGQAERLTYPAFLEKVSS